MQPGTLQTKPANQWEGSVTFRNPATPSPRNTGALAEDIESSNEDQSAVGDETNQPRPATAQDAAARKLHLKRAVKARKLASGAPSTKPDQKQDPDEAQSVVRYTESPSWLLEPDGDEVSPLLASPFPHELVSRSLHNSQ